MNRYAEMREKRQAEINALPIKFAFSDEQFEKAMAEWGFTVKDTDKIYSLGMGGGFYRREDAELIRDVFARTAKELEDAIAEDKTGEGFIYEMFLYELANHEYGYTLDDSDTLDSLDYTREDLKNDKRLAVGLKKAKEEILRREEE